MSEALVGRHKPFNIVVCVVKKTVCNPWKEVYTVKIILGHHSEAAQIHLFVNLIVLLRINTIYFP